MLQDKDLYRVLIPNRIFLNSVDKEQLKQSVLQYMKRYPNYYVKKIENGMAVCIRNE